MEDEKTHENNLLQLKLPSSSSASSNPLPITPPDADAFGGFFNHGAINNDHLLPNYPLITNSTMFNHHSSASFMPAAEIETTSYVNPAQIINSNGVMGGKRRRVMSSNRSGKLGEAAEKQPGEVIHVRAKRGQATDSHSLAERVRRERINEKLKVLQDLVPGCYKTMGMAVMLDVIINYVRSLQNQIEFLSMKLSAASMFYDFNSPEAEALEALQRTNPCEAREMERMMRDEGFDQGLASDPAAADHDLHFTWPF